MFRNYFKIAWRSIFKRKIFSFINIFGLALSIASCVLICTYIYNELNYDTYSANSDELYRVELHLKDNGSITVFPNIDVAVGNGLKKAFPEILASSRLSPLPDVYLKNGSEQFKEQNLATVDSNFLKLFSIPLIEGNINKALVEPNSIVISKKIGKKYFGNQSAVGKTLELSGKKSLLVTGVIDKVPENSHFNYNIFLSTSTFPYSKGDTWSNIGWTTYLLLNKNTDVAKLESKFPDLVAEHIVPEIQKDMNINLSQARESLNKFQFLLRPVKTIHLYSHTKYELQPNGHIQYIYIFSALVIFILALACVNFTNLSTASAAQRSTEVGIRKVLGSNRKPLIFRFLSESILIALFAMILAFAIIYLALPWFNQISGENRTFWFFLQPLSLLAILGFTIFVGLLAGVYPAFFLSSFKTIKTLKGGTNEILRNKGFLRNGLVVFQFSVSMILIIATMIAYQQLNYMQNKQLGYNKEQVVLIPDSYLLGNQQQTFKQKLLNNSQISNVSIASGIPSDPNLSGSQVYPKSNQEQEANSEIHINIYNIDDSYIPTMGMTMLKGRNFSKEFVSDSTAVIINEAAVKALGWQNENVIDKSIVKSGGYIYNVIGIVKDFQYNSAKENIAPLMMRLNPFSSGTIIVKINTVETKAILSSIQTEWELLNNQGAFSYTFLDKNYDRLYRSEERNGQLFSVFALLAIIIANIGLFGLVAFAAVQRTKEIGVRKVLGSSVPGIILLLTKDFIKLIGIAALFAVPIAWYVMRLWLENFAFRIDIKWWVFLIAGITSMVIALITVSSQAIKAAIQNPVKSLRTE
ncbi:ABC transporter permease [Zunongwangia sp. F363]|uniref:ABC transporter permease n=1 Tax=Autumnicola tepida TaxID=3075595 RepID=A0ABU3CDW0_9FLAO|nr:ABC transporter permease [Zunongwangia sp. F363]MDT0644543.1 ABC transporter permease [Zunongwangia sp. F363]